MSHTRLLPPHWQTTPAVSSLPGREQRPPRSRGPGVVRLAIFCVLWLAIFVWPVPAAGALLAHQTYALTSEAVSSLVRGAAQPHALWQVGLQAGADDAHATAMRATISTRLPQHVAAGTTSYYWVGSYLAGGSFIQEGYYVPGYAPSSAGWFYCAFTRAGAKGPCVYGPLGSVSGAAHTYALSAAKDADGRAIWNATLDGRDIGSFTWSAGESGTTSPAVYAESSATQPHGAESILGPVTISGFAVRPHDASDYRPVSAVYPAYSAGDVCPPYGMRALGNGRAELGSGLECPTPIAALW
ncbi:MAG TPA: hypothetical protein VF116_23475 [Ktedonobacterales bacterium]